ncbi:LytTR family transcriptional regulator [Marinilabiliaceae bacterium JC017]|nr:LytTR family transcriptional regulator [Marinilabiliaceae bacterium JC017]
MDFSKHIPDYLVEKGNIVRLILLTASFALVFINIYAPFGVTTWFLISKLQLLFFSSLIILTGVLVVVISRVIMYQVYRRKIKLNYAQYLLWIAVEIVSMALFYTLYELMILKDARPFADAFKISLLNTSLVLLLPYSTLWLYFSWRDKKLQLEAISEGQERPGDTNQMIPFRDERGTMRFSIKSNDLLYMKGADNYVTIFYNDHNKHAKFLLRNTLKKLEEQLKERAVIRCHRSFMVNFDRVKLVEREKDGLKLKLDTTPVVEVPVSKTYMGDVFKQFEQFS